MTQLNRTVRVGFCRSIKFTKRRGKLPVSPPDLMTFRFVRSILIHKFRFPGGKRWPIVPKCPSELGGPAVNPLLDLTQYGRGCPEATPTLPNLTRDDAARNAPDTGSRRTAAQYAPAVRRRDFAAARLARTHACCSPVHLAGSITHAGDERVNNKSCDSYTTGILYVYVYWPLHTCAIVVVHALTRCAHNAVVTIIIITLKKNVRGGETTGVNTITSTNNARANGRV